MFGIFGNVKGKILTVLTVCIAKQFI